MYTRNCQGAIKMNKMNSLRFVLHVSDFHLSENTIDSAKDALRSLATTLKDKRFRVEYLLHTGDIIEARDLPDLASSVFSNKKASDQYYTNGKFDFSKFVQIASDEETAAYNSELTKLVNNRFELAEEVFQEFIQNLNIPSGNVVVCCGNHDVPRFVNSQADNQPMCIDNGNNWNKYIDESSCKHFERFEEFLNNIGAANSTKRNPHVTQPVSFCQLNDINVLVLNTNWPNPRANIGNRICINCSRAQAAIETSRQYWDPQQHESTYLNIVMAHKPIYEICETARLPYDPNTKPMLMEGLQSFVGVNGAYFCGDKHTQSISRSFIHDIPHYLGGEPLDPQRTKEVEYNLLEIKDGQIGMERKVHLSFHDKDGANTWTCGIRPQDKTAATIFEYCRKYIPIHSLRFISNTKQFHTWESVRQEIYANNNTPEQFWNAPFNNYFMAVSKFREYGLKDNDKQWKPEDNIFQTVSQQLISKISNEQSKNILNLRGEYDTGKSTFLGLLFLYLLLQYHIGNIDFIPAYFNLENSSVLERINTKNETYFNAVRFMFSEYADSIQKIALKEHQKVCYIIDGLDQQDCWSYSSEDSIGRGLLDILAMYPSAWYVMAFSQHWLPHFKNTMPERQYSDRSDVLYFNPIDIPSKLIESSSILDATKDFQHTFYPFVKSFIELGDRICDIPHSALNLSQTDEERVLHNICTIIQKFRRLTINQGFMYRHYDYITERTEQKDGNITLINTGSDVSKVYQYYIDRQQEVCLDKLGYGFINYAPAMAYLFSYCGFTYERFKQIGHSDLPNERHILDPIRSNQDKVYNAFLFIKKNRDAREYLVALHYNRELRYYAENPDIPISNTSILNQFISRDTAVLIRKMWTDVNKFVIVCDKLLLRKELHYCTQSMLLYCLAHINLFPPIREGLKHKMINKANETLSFAANPEKGKALYDPKYPWQVMGKTALEQLESFLLISLRHTMCIFSDEITEIIANPKKFSEFFKYNNRHQLLYYGDLCIRGEVGRARLNPTEDKVQDGFDFYNCFNYLGTKLSSHESYDLEAFDKCTLASLFSTRLKTDNRNSFFYSREKDADYKISLQTEVLKNALSILTPNESFIEQMPEGKLRDAVSDAIGQILKEQYNETKL